MVKIRNSIAEEKERERKSNFRFIAVLMIIALVLYTLVVIFTQCLLTVLIDGDSMNPTIKDGEIVVVSRYSGIQYGDVVVIDMGNRLLIKRVIGMGGDTIEIQDGKVYRNGKLLKENYTMGETTSLYTYVNVKEGEIYFLGDNRENSNDSRAEGTVKESQIVGVMLERDSVLAQIKIFFHNLVGALQKKVS